MFFRVAKMRKSVCYMIEVIAIFSIFYITLQMLQHLLHTTNYRPIESRLHQSTENKVELSSNVQNVHWQETRTSTHITQKPKPSPTPSLQAAGRGNAEHVANSNTGPVTNVLFFTYSRSGSSFLGEVLNRNKAGFYHFEPLYGMYSALYGIGDMASMRVFHYNNGTDRWPTLHEADFIAEHTINLLSCNLQRLPVEVLQDRFSMTTNKEIKFSKYKKCLRNSLTTTGEKLSQFSPAYNCKNLIKNQCGHYFDGKREFKCFQGTFGKPLPLANNTIRNRLLNLSVNVEQFERLLPDTTSHIEEFRKHNKCVISAQSRSDGCIDKLAAPCRDSTVRGAKVIRMRMENMAHILAKDPDVKVIHYFRDPRGIELSRSPSMRRDKQLQMIQDGELTCRKMRQDIAARKLLETRYPHTFMVLKYEDLATDPETTIANIYNFLNVSIPSEVKEWVITNTNSQGTNVHDKLGTSRKNSTATALRWRTQVPQETSAKIAQICHDILQELNYNI